jgi:glutathione S-transferase
VLDHNGNHISESRAIERYIAAELGYYGSTTLERAHIDVVCDVLADLRTSSRKIRSLTTDDEKAAAKKKFYHEELPAVLKQIDEYLAKTGGEGGHAVGKKLSLADISLYHNLTAVWADDKADVDAALAGNARVLASVESVKSNDHVAKYVAGRPKTAF